MRAAIALALALGLMPAAAGAGEFFTLKGHGGPVMGLATAADGRIATASFDNLVGLWTGRNPRWLEEHRAAVNTVAFAGPGTLVSGGDDVRVLAWDLATGTPRVLHEHGAKVTALAAAGGTVASASWDGTVALTALDTGATRLLVGHESGVNAVAFAAGGARLYSAGSDGTIRLWDTGAAREVRPVVRHGFAINELALGPGGAWLAYGAVDGVTRVIDPATGARIADFTLDRRPILALAHSPAAGRLAVGDGEGWIMVVDTAAWRIARDFRATDRGPVWALAFSPDGANIHAAGLDNVVYSWPRAAMDDHGPMQTAARPYLRDPAEMTNGERQFMRKCAICHTLTPDGGRRAGPTLHGLFGRPAGSVPGYRYSRTLRESDIVWTAATIDALFDQGPDHYVPGSKMPMQRIAGEGDRADLIGYLRRASRGEDD